MGLFTKTSGDGWSFDRKTGILTISGDLGSAICPFAKIANKVRSVRAHGKARVTIANSLFKDMKNLEEAYLAMLDVSQCQDMAYMFSGCTSLTSCDLSGWKTSNTVRINSMFHQCTNLKTLKLRNWDTGIIGNMAYMLKGCRKLQNLDMTGWRVHEDASVDFMFFEVPRNVKLISDDEKLMHVLQNEAPAGDEEMRKAVNELVRLQEEENRSIIDIRYRYGESSFKGMLDRQIERQVPAEKNEESVQEKETVKAEKITGTGWHFDPDSGILTIDGNLGNVSKPFKSIARRVRSVTAVEGAAVSDGRGLFENMDCLASADLAELDVSGCPEMSSMFYGCSALKELDLYDWNTDQLAKTDFMFAHCHQLESIETGQGWDFSCVTDARYMFAECYELRYINPDGWSGISIENCSAMFRECRCLEKLDLRPLHIADCRDYSCMFRGCGNLRILLLDGWYPAEAEDMQEMFMDCGNLETLSIGGWRVPDGVNCDGMFDGVSQEVRICAGSTLSIPQLPEDLTVVPCGWDLDYAEETLIIDGKLPDWSHVSSYLHEPAWSCAGPYITHVIAKPGAKAATCEGMFKECRWLLSADLKNLDVSEVWNMDEMFWSCVRLKEIDLSGMNVSNVKTMNNMFGDCTSLQSADLSGWDVSNVRVFDRVFCNCGNLKHVSLDGWNFTKPYLITGFFEGCGSLAYDPQPGIMRNTDAGWSFDASDGILTITGDLGDVKYPFGTIAPQVRTIKTEEGAKVRDAGALFRSMKNLVSADLKELDTEQCTDMSYMFSECGSLQSVQTGACFTCENVRDMSRMFDGCSELRELDASGWKADAVKRIEGMFCFCTSLETADLTGLNVSNVSDFSNLFAVCMSLRTVNLTSWKISASAVCEDAFMDVPEDVHIAASDRSVERLVPAEIKPEFRSDEKELSAAEMLEIADAEWNKDDTDFEKALQYYILAAEKGNYAGAYRIGRMFSKGWGTEQSDEKAAEWMKLAAEHGDDKALVPLANYYIDGTGVKQDYEEAVRLLRLAAEKGNMTAVNNLGYMYENGFGVEQDDALAFHQYLKAAEGGVRVAMYHAGECFESGKGTQKDPEQALYWYKKSMDAGYARAEEKVMKMTQGQKV